MADYGYSKTYVNCFCGRWCQEWVTKEHNKPFKCSDECTTELGEILAHQKFLDRQNKEIRELEEEKEVIERKIKAVKASKSVKEIHDVIIYGKY